MTENDFKIHDDDTFSYCVEVTVPGVNPRDSLAHTLLCDLSGFNFRRETETPARIRDAVLSLHQPEQRRIRVFKNLHGQTVRLEFE